METRDTETTLIIKVSGIGDDLGEEVIDSECLKERERERERCVRTTSQYAFFQEEREREREKPMSIIRCYLLPSRSCQCKKCSRPTRYKAQRPVISSSAVQ